MVSRPAARHADGDHRQGSALGVIIAVPTLNWIIVNHSWHWAFGALGIAGLAWVVLWMLFGREGTLVDQPVHVADGMVERLGLTWFTSYLVDGLGYSQTAGGNLTILPWIFGMCVVLTGGWLSQRLRKAGVSSRLSRGVLAASTVTLGGCILPFVGSMPTPGLKVAALVVGAAIGSSIYVVTPMIVSELTPQPQRAAMLAITSSIVTLAGVIAPLAMGAIIQNASSPLAGYEQSYVILGGLLLAGGIIGLVFIRPEADRARLAAHSVMLPVAVPARA